MVESITCLPTHGWILLLLIFLPSLSSAILAPLFMHVPLLSSSLPCDVFFVRSDNHTVVPCVIFSAPPRRLLFSVLFISTYGFHSKNRNNQHLPCDWNHYPNHCQKFIYFSSYKDDRKRLSKSKILKSPEEGEMKYGGPIKTSSLSFIFIFLGFM